MCDYEGCDNKPEYYDGNDNQVCEGCMNREVLEYKDGNFEDYESIVAVEKAIAQN